MSLLVAEGLSKAYASRRRRRRRDADHNAWAVRDVSFSLERGETLALVGESGAGKSTVGRLILRLVEPTSGSLTFDGVDIFRTSRNELTRLRRSMHVIFQDPYGSLDPLSTIGDSIEEPLLAHHVGTRAENRRRVSELLEIVGLRSSDAEKRPLTFSGGELQRVAIARAVALDPKLIVCDEPVAALDVSVRAQIMNLLLDLQEHRGTSYLFITHDLGILPNFADRIAVMNAGRIVESGSVTEVIADPKDPYTQDLVAAIPRIRTSRSEELVASDQSSLDIEQPPG